MRGVMNTFTVSFFGHRIIENPIEVEKRLYEIIREIIRNNEYIEFLVGREGDFDLLVSAVIKNAIKKLDYGNTSLVLVLPYLKAEYKNNVENFERYYDEIEICEKSQSAHFKSAISLRNKEMIDRSALVVCYVERNSGGAYDAYKYAQSKRKTILNLSDNMIL